MIEQITKHLNRLIDVVKVNDLTESSFIERELMLIKVRAAGKDRDEMKRMAEIFRGRIIDVTDKTYTVELTGDTVETRRIHRGAGRDRRSWRLSAPAVAASAAANGCSRSDRQRTGKGRTMKVFYDKDCDLKLIKSKTVAIIGYGSQGHAHALNLADSGVKKLAVGVRKGGPSDAKVKKAKLTAAGIEEAVSAPTS